MKNKKLLAAALLAAGALLRAAYVVKAYPSVFPFGWTDAKRYEPLRIKFDPDGYDQLAQNLLTIHSLARDDGRPLTSREPLYPILLAGAHVLLGRTFVVGLLVNLAFGLLCCWTVHLLTLAMFGSERAALIALGIACFFPEWIYYGGYMYREPLVGLLLALWAWLWTVSEGKADWKPYLWMGLIYGGVSLTRSPMIPLGGTFCLLAIRRLAPRDWLKTLGLFFLTAGLVQTPWVIRNYRLLGHFVAGSSMGGSVMYLSLLKDYDKPEEALEAPLAADVDPVIRGVEAKGLTQDQADPEYYRACWEILKHQPRRFWGAFLRKTFKLWRPFPNAGWEYHHSLLALQITGLVSNGGLMAAGLAGFVLARRRKAPIGFPLMVLAAMTVVYGFFWAVTRYHSPLMFAFMPPAALAIDELLG